MKPKIYKPKRLKYFLDSDPIDISLFKIFGTKLSGLNLLTIEMRYPRMTINLY